MQYISTTFAYGNGPYLRCVDLCLAINEEFKQRGEDEFGILVPLVYGDKQKKIMWENFGEHIKKNPNQILFDKNYGKLLDKLFYKGGSYQENLEFLIKNQPKIEATINDHLESNFKAENFDGKNFEIKPGELAFEISHNPRVATHFAGSFYTTIAYFSEILSRSIYEKELGLDKNVLKQATEIATKIEKDKVVHFMPEPFTFSHNPSSHTFEEIFTPPFVHVPKKNDEEIQEGMYVTLTGIPGLEKLYESVNKFNMELYSPPFVNSPHIKKENFRSADILSNKNIKFQFARGGWSSVWNSHMTETPLICPKYTKGDDPEIFFNEKTLKKLGIATIFSHNSDPKDILEKASSQVQNMQEINEKLIQRYGTLDGINYTAKVIADFLEGKDISKYPRDPVLR